MVLADGMLVTAWVMAVGSIGSLAVAVWAILEARSAKTEADGQAVAIQALSDAVDALSGRHNTPAWEVTPKPITLRSRSVIEFLVRNVGNGTAIGPKLSGDGIRPGIVPPSMAPGEEAEFLVRLSPMPTSVVVESIGFLPLVIELPERRSDASSGRRRPTPAPE